MIPIPKELQNQKAIPFMEWCNNAIILYRKTYGNDNEIDIFKIKRILDFYNQPFTPEMLQEYFEKFNCDRFAYNDQNMFIDIYMQVVYKFENLNDFLVFLKTKLELTWKGEK